MGFIKDCIDTCMDSIFKAKISGMKYNDFIHYVFGRQFYKDNHKNIKIKETRKIVHKKISYHVYNNNPYDYHPTLHSGHAYYVVFEYVILKRELSGYYSMATRSVNDCIWFTTLKEAELYKKHAMHPSITVYTYADMDYQLMSFNEISDNPKYDFCARYDNQFGCYYFFNGHNMCNTTMSLDLLFDEYGLFKEETKDNIKVQDKEENSLIKNNPKIQFLLMEEIERTEGYLKRLKKLV